MLTQTRSVACAVRSAPARTGGGLADCYGRAHTYLRVSVTDRCNLRCVYCMPSGGLGARSDNNQLTLDEIARLVEYFARWGVNKVRLTGGEPLVRPGIPGLVSRIAAIPGVETVALTTNGVLLAAAAEPLRRAGLCSVNLSLDTLRRDRFETLAMRSRYEEVRAGLEAALAAGFESVKVNVVIIRGVNDDEIPDFVRLSRERDLHVRFIEYMPFRDNHWMAGRVVTVAEMRHRIEQQTGPLDVAPSESARSSVSRDFELPGGEGRIGFISTVSDHFCAHCNRLRLTAGGQLKTCLFSAPSASLLPLLRSGVSEEDLAAVVRTALGSKWPARPALEAVGGARENMVEIGG